MLSFVVAGITLLGFFFMLKPVLCDEIKYFLLKCWTYTLKFSELSNKTLHNALQLSSFVTQRFYQKISCFRTWSTLLMIPNALRMANPLFHNPYKYTSTPNIIYKKVLIGFMAIHRELFKILSFLRMCYSLGVVRCCYSFYKVVKHCIVVLIYLLSYPCY